MNNESLIQAWYASHKTFYCKQQSARISEKCCMDCQRLAMRAIKNAGKIQTGWVEDDYGEKHLFSCAACKNDKASDRIKNAPKKYVAAVLKSAAKYGMKSGGYGFEDVEDHAYKFQLKGFNNDKSYKDALQ
jgi:hypothetical protein